MASNSGSPCSKQVFEKADVPDVVTPRNTASFGRRIHGHLGSPRCIFPHPHFTSAQEIPTVQCGWQGLSVQGPSLWATLGTQGVHKGPGPSSSTPPAGGNTNISILRRFLIKASSYTNADNHIQRCLCLFQSLGLCQFQQVTTRTIPKTSFLGSNPRHTASPSFRVGRKAKQDTGHGSEFTLKKVRFSPTIQVFSGDGLFLHSFDTELPSRDEASSRRTQPAMAASLRLIRGPHLDHPLHPKCSSLVDSEKEFTTGLCVPPRRTKLYNHHGRIPRRLGSTFSRADYQREMDSSTETLAHQSVGAESHLPSPKVFSRNHPRSHSIGSHRQYYQHALFEQTGRNKIDSSVTGSPRNMCMGNTTHNQSSGGPCTGNCERSCGYSQQDKGVHPRMGTSTNQRWI
ncbi:uncharacterized protein LOC144799281 [Lissotriton helveticus]